MYIATFMLGALFTFMVIYTIGHHIRPRSVEKAADEFLTGLYNCPPEEQDDYVIDYTMRLMNNEIPPFRYMMTEDEAERMATMVAELRANEEFDIRHLTLANLRCLARLHPKYEEALEYMSRSLQ